MNEIKVSLINEDARFFIVVSRFNEFVTQKLVDGCKDELSRHRVKQENISLIWVPGAFEIPLVAKLAAERGYDAVICLGSVIRGETPHFEYVAAEVSKGIANVALQTSKPVIYGIITADTVDQALDRAGTKAGNRGRDAAISAIEMVNIVDKLKK